MLENENLFSLTVDNSSKAHLLQAAKWARFLGITGMIFLALWLIAIFFGVSTIGTVYGNFSVNGERAEAASNAVRTGLIGIGLVGTLIIFFPLLFLLQFGNRAKQAVLTNHQESLIKCFQELKKYFRYLGVITLIFIVLYGLMFVIGILGLVASR